MSKNIPLRYGDASDLNAQLFNMIGKVEDLLIFVKTEQIKEPLVFLKEKFRPDCNTATLSTIKIEIDGNNPKLNKDFFFQVDSYINTKLKRVSKD